MYFIIIIYYFYLFRILKEQWIRAKYERKEFMNSTDTTYNKGYMEGILWKKGKENNKFNKRRFILSQVDCSLKYFVKDVSSFYYLFYYFFSKKKKPKVSIGYQNLNSFSFT